MDIVEIPKEKETVENELEKPRKNSKDAIEEEPKNKSYKESTKYKR